jgi:PAS domain S-box-containing protein
MIRFFNYKKPAYKIDDQLLQNYEFYKSAFELAKDAKIVLEDCVIIRFNPATMKIFKCDDPEQIYHHKLSEFLSSVVTKESVKEQCEGNFFIETELQTCAGNWVPVNISFDTLSKNGKIKTIATIHDITDKIQTRRELKESNEFIYKVLDNLPIGIGVKTIDHKTIKYMNEKFPIIWGWPKEVVEDFDLFFDKAYPNPGESARIKELVLSSLQKENLAHWPMVKVHDMNGNERLLDITMFLMKDQDSMITIVQNVTQELKDRAWLKVKSAAIKAIPNGIVITDAEGNIIWVNPAFTQIYGYELDEVKGQNPRILKSGKHPEEFYKNIWDTIKAGKTWKGKVINKRKDNSLFEDSQLIAPVRAGGAEITHFIAIKNLTDQELDYNPK